MLIKEFLCVHEYGTVIFHRKYEERKSQDIVLRSGLLSALVNYADEVENDSISEIHMKKVTLLFKKKELLIFILFLDPTINTSWCRQELVGLTTEFFKRYPEIIWQTEIVNLAKFGDYKEDVDQILFPLNEKLELIVLLLEENLILEKEFTENDLNTLGSIVGSRFLEKYYDQFNYAVKHKDIDVYTQIDNAIIQLSGEHVERIYQTYYLDCNLCSLCTNEKKDCFYEGFLKVLLTTLGLEVKININGG